MLFTPSLFENKVLEMIFISFNSDTDGSGYIVQVWRLNHWKVK